VHQHYNEQDPDDDPADWEGVEVHEHDGHAHMIVRLEPRPRAPWWRQPAMWRLHAVEFTVVAVFAAVAVFVVATGGSLMYLWYAVVLCGVMVMAVLRAINAYRVGYRMGIEAMPLAMAQPTPKAAAELIDRGSELWDPTPSAVAHTMAIERLEREANRGSS
jgi:hypothetical protein